MNRIQTKKDTKVLISPEDFTTGMLAITINKVEIYDTIVRVNLSYHQLLENTNGSPGNAKYNPHPISIKNATPQTKNSEIVVLSANEANQAFKSVGQDIIANSENFVEQLNHIVTQATLDRIISLQKWRKIDNEDRANLLTKEDFEILTEVQKIE